MKLLIVTQIVDPEDYVFGFFYGHILDLANTYEQVQVLCLEHRGGDLPANVTVVSLGKESNPDPSQLQYLRHFYSFLFFKSKPYDTVLIHMEPLYVLLGGWWWRLSGKKLVLWYNHIYRDGKLSLASSFVNAIIGVSKKTIPVSHSRIELIRHDRDLTSIMREISSS